MSGAKAKSVAVSRRRDSDDSDGPQRAAKRATMEAGTSSAAVDAAGAAGGAGGDPDALGDAVGTSHEVDTGGAGNAGAGAGAGSSSDESGGEDEADGPSSLIVQFQTMEGEPTGPQLDIPLDTTQAQMEELVNELLENDERTPYAFFVNDEELLSKLRDAIAAQKLSTEVVLPIKYQPLSIFRVMPVARCTDTLPGHTDAVLHVSFSPDGLLLASGGGDATVRFWDVLTATPKYTCQGHRHHVLCTAWSPDGLRFVSADRVGEVRVWNPKSGKEVCKPLKRHRQWITSLAWEPMHLNAACERVASSSKDKTVKIWNVRTGAIVASLSGHTDSVECVKWGGEGLIYTASRDRTIKVWALEGNRGKLVRTLIGHAHRINSLALSTDYVCRTGPFDHTGKRPASVEEAVEKAKKRYAEIAATGPERLISCSDDFTLFLWEPNTNKRPIQRMTGHQQLVNHISFSPDGRYAASAGFDKKVRLWDGRKGKFIATLTGHVGAVYQVCWSPDSRLVASASKDSTVKLWSLADTKRAKATLPGHADEVYALDWSPNGQRVASGSKDRTVKIWRH